MKIKEKIKRGIIGLLLLSLPLSFQSCTVDDILGYLLEIISQTGWLAEDEDMDNIPEDITPFDNDDSQPFRSVVSLEEKFPPIGDQGSYGTCVTWAVGYNLKTSLNAIEKGWNQSDLGNKSNFEKTFFLNTVRFKEVNGDNLILKDTYFGNKTIEN